MCTTTVINAGIRELYIHSRKLYFHSRVILKRLSRAKMRNQMTTLLAWIPLTIYYFKHECNPIQIYLKGNYVVFADRSVSKIRGVFEFEQTTKAFMIRVIYKIAVWLFAKYWHKYLSMWLWFLYEFVWM